MTLKRLSTAVLSQSNDRIESAAVLFSNRAQLSQRVKSRDALTSRSMSAIAYYRQLTKRANLTFFSTARSSLSQNHWCPPGAHDCECPKSSL